MGTKVKPGQGKLWKLGYYSEHVPRSNGLISTTGSKINATGDERPQLGTTIARTATLPKGKFSKYKISSAILAALLRGILWNYVSVK